MKSDEITLYVFFYLLVIKLAERSLCFRILSLRYAEIFFWLICSYVLYWEKNKAHLYVMDTLILCTLSFYRTGSALKLFYRKVF